MKQCEMKDLAIAGGVHGIDEGVNVEKGNYALSGHTHTDNNNNLSIIITCFYFHIHRQLRTFKVA